MQTMLTAERLRDLVVYEPETGMFRWRVSRPGCRAGDECGRVNSFGYAEVGVDGKLRRANRLAVLYMTGEWPSGVVDHINRDRADNRWANLRCGSHQQNCWNVGARGVVKGISWDATRRKWLAQARIDGVKRNLGRYACFALAVKAHRDAVRQAHGEFAAFA